MLNRWLSCIARLESEMPSEQFRPWIKPLRFIGFDESEHKLRIGVRSAYKLNLIKDQFEGQLMSVVRELFSPNTTISLELHTLDDIEPEPVLDDLEESVDITLESVAALHTDGSLHATDIDGTKGDPLANGMSARASHTDVANTSASNSTMPITGVSAPLQLTPRIRAALQDPRPQPTDHGDALDDASHYDRASRLRRDLTFAEFVEGRGNQMALSSAMEIVDKPGRQYNPLVVVGGVGLGKTHLLHAVGNALQHLRPNIRVQYVHAQEYFEEMVRAIQRKNPQEFKQRYQNLDLLLIDDIQFLGGKERTQEEFFYTFEALFSSRKQLMITSDTYPKELGEFQDRLKSRLSSGLIVEIEQPDIETRTAILLKKAEGLNADVPNDVAQFIAKHLRSNVRELEGALLRVIAFARFRNRIIGIDLAREALNDLLELNRPPISIEQIQRIVADQYKIKVADMYSKRRPAHIALARQVAMYFAKEITQKSFPEIGEAFGGRDHTTVMHAVKKIAELRQKDSEENRKLHVLEQSLRA
jgi:chromosomal replication initiator protein